MDPVYIGAPAPRRSNPWAWVVGIVLVCGLLAVLAVAALVVFGWSLFAAEAQAVLQDDPVIAEHIGTIREMDVDIVATGDADGADEFVWDLEGDKGAGRVLAEVVTEDEGEVLASGTLTLADGRVLQLGGQADIEALADSGTSAGDGSNAKSEDATKSLPPPDPEPDPVEVE